MFDIATKIKDLSLPQDGVEVEGKRFLSVKTKTKLVQIMDYSA